MDIWDFFTWVDQGTCFNWALDAGSPAASVVCSRRVVEDPLRGPVGGGAAAGVF